MSYLNATNEYLRENDAPTCSLCGAKMFPSDDHGNFTCFCNLGRSTSVVTGFVHTSQSIPQTDASEMSDVEKEKIPALNRLNDAPTDAESRELSKMLDVWGPPA